MLITASSRSFFGHGQCQAGSSGDVINGVWLYVRSNSIVACDVACITVCV